MKQRSRLSECSANKSQRSNVDDMLQKLKAIFRYYASYGDRLNATNLKSNKFHKLMQDSLIEVINEDKKRLDLIFYSQNKSKPNMTFDTFLNSLPIIAEFKYPDMQDSPTVLNVLLQENILPLYDKITENESLDIEINEQIVNVLRNIENTLYEIYISYFPWEQTTSDVKDVVLQRSIKAAFKLLDEFEVCPAVISKTVAFNIIRSVIENRKEVDITHNIGTVLTFPKFLYLLVKIGYFAYGKEVTGEEYSVEERLHLLLERMELSEGFANIEKKTNRPYTAKTFLLPHDYLAEKVTYSDTDKMRQEFPQTNIIPELPDNEGGDQLLSVFKKYCSYGEPLNTSKLKSSRFMKMLKDCNLISDTYNPGEKKLKAVDADLIYAKVTAIKKSKETSIKSVMAPSTSKIVNAPYINSGTKILDSNKKKVVRVMEYEEFIEAIKMAAAKIFGDMDTEQALDKLVKEYLLQLEEPDQRVVSNETLTELMELTKEKEMEEFLEVIHKSLYPYYKAYTIAHDMMGLEEFIRFCSDFGIFPDIMAKPRLDRIFHGISLEHKKIDSELFVRALALCALEVAYKVPQPTSIEKVN